MQTVIKSGLIILGIAAFSSLVASNPNGVFNRGSTGCGSCHGSTPNANGTVSVGIAAAQVVQTGKTIPVTVSVTGGPGGTTGGFTLDSNAGTLVAGANTRVSGSSIVQSSNSSRSWSFQFTGTTPGLARWTTVAMSSNGSGTGGDSWGYWGPNSGQAGTPYRVFVTDTQVFPYGSACAGTLKFAPVLGAAKNLAIANVSTIELHNVKPNTVALLVLGFSNKSWGAIPLPFDLGLLGAPSCSLHAALDLSFVNVATGSGDGNGFAQWPIPVPADAALRGQHLYFQTLVLDAVNSLGLVSSGGLDCVIQ